MKRRAIRELELATFATRHGWPAMIADHEADEADVMTTLDALLVSMPGRRRVRALELASMIEHQLHPTTTQGRRLNEALIESLRVDYQHAFPVRPPPQRSAQGPSVLLAATPRSGNTLLQRLFAELFDYAVIAAPTIDDIAADQVIAPVLMQVHAVNNRQAHRFVDQVGARVLTIARHPLDVLLSMLHFSRHEPQILDWLDGAGVPGPETLRGASPTSSQFVDWASGRGAARLLALTQGWWNDAVAVGVRYEDLVASTTSVLEKLVAELGITARLDEVDPEATREQTLVGLANHHRWRSKADGWQELLTAPVAERLHRAHRKVFDDLGYDMPAPSTLTDDEANRNWRQLKR
ncbi:MAG: sulfotransferase domain-containing protein [Acidimicrobiia bacterium]|nr:sulfotransferase domain-containing protein [Acidimicrobiia bacterium]